MSIHKITTHVVECDRCEERFGDVVPLEPETVHACARNHGWNTNEDGTRHTCPECLKKESDRMQASLKAMRERAIFQGLGGKP